MYARSADLVHTKTRSLATKVYSDQGRVSPVLLYGLSLDLYTSLIEKKPSLSHCPSRAHYEAKKGVAGFYTGFFVGGGGRRWR